MEQIEETNELSWSEQVETELAKKNEDPTYVMTLPEGAVIDAEMPDGYYRKRPCKEEFLAAYPKLDYDRYFNPEGIAATDEFDWGPGWSDPQWAARAALTRMELPEYFQVRSQVRRVATRSKRAAAPTRHRFKQFLFGNPSFRMVRGRHVKVPAMLVLTNLDELVAKEEVGLLSVHMPDGRYVDLMALKAGQLEAAPAPVPAPQPNPPLDSITQDVNGGEHIPEMLDGTYYNDPAAERAVENMLKDKANELHRDETTLEEDEEAEKKAAAKTDPINPPPAPEAAALAPEALTDTEVAATDDATEVASEPASTEDPAAARLAETEPPVEDKVLEIPVEEEAPKTQANKPGKNKGGKK